MSKKIVLDVGAGEHPDKRATHALDKMSKRDILELYEESPSKFRSKVLPKLAQKGTYYTGRDINKKGTIPKELKGKVDLIVSSASIGAGIGGKTAGENLGQLAKPTGRVEIELGYIGERDKQGGLRVVKTTMVAGDFAITSLKDKKQGKTPQGLVLGELKLKARKGGRLLTRSGRTIRQRRGSVI